MNFHEMTDEALALMSDDLDAAGVHTPEDEYIDLDWWGEDR